MFCHTYYSIKRTADSIIGLSLYIRSTVPPASSVCRNHFTTGKRKTIFILFYTIQMNGETFALIKEPGVLTLIWFTSIAVKLLLAGPPAHATTLMNNKIVIVCFSLSYFKIN